MFAQRAYGASYIQIKIHSVKGAAAAHAAFVEGKTEPRRLHAFKQEFYQNCLGSRVFFLQRFESLQRKQQKLRLRLIFLSRIGKLLDDAARAAICNNVAAQRKKLSISVQLVTE